MAVDGGLHLADELGLVVDLIVGDMDSVDPDRLDSVAARGVEIIRHPVDKDATDLELALDELVARRVERVVVLGSDAGRLDHLLAGVAVLARPAYAAIDIEAWLGGAHVLVVRRPTSFDGRTGALVSLLAVGGPAEGVRTDGLSWPLDGDTLEPGSTRGVSNRFVARRATVGVDRGCVVVVIPEPES